MALGKVVSFVKDIHLESFEENGGIVSKKFTNRKFMVVPSEGTGVALPYEILGYASDDECKELIGHDVWVSVCLHRDGDYISRLEVGDDGKKEESARSTGKTARKRQNRQSRTAQ